MRPNIVATKRTGGRGKEKVDAADLSGQNARLTEPGWVIKSHVSSDLLAYADDSSRISGF